MARTGETHAAFPGLASNAGVSRTTIRYRSIDYAVVPRPDLAIAGVIPWCLELDGAMYQVATDETHAARGARDFLHIGIRSALTPRTPNFLANTRYPLLLSIDGVAVRGWPVTVDENRWPVWLFESTGCARSECGTITAEQTLADVEDLAKLWLRTSDSAES